MEVWEVGVGDIDLAVMVFFWSDDMNDYKETIPLNTKQ